MILNKIKNVNVCISVNRITVLLALSSNQGIMLYMVLCSFEIIVIAKQFKEGRQRLEEKSSQLKVKPDQRCIVVYSA